MTSLDVTPRPMEVAAAWLPAGVAVTLHGDPVHAPDPDHVCYAVVGWHRVSGGAVTCVYGNWQGIRNGQDRHSRPVWEEAAKILRQAAGRGVPCAVYVAVEDQRRYGRRHLTAVRVRREGDV